MQRYCILSGAIRAKRQPSRSRGGLLFSWRLPPPFNRHPSVFALQPVVIRAPRVVGIRWVHEGVDEIKVLVAGTRGILLPQGIVWFGNCGCGWGSMAHLILCGAGGFKLRESYFDIEFMELNGFGERTSLVILILNTNGVMISSNFRQHT